MKIVHDLNTNFTFHLHCPFCGAPFQNQYDIHRLLEYKKNLKSGRRIKLLRDDVNENIMIYKKVCKCSKCIFEIEYHLNLMENIKRVN